MNSFLAFTDSKSPTFKKVMHSGYTGISYLFIIIVAVCELQLHEYSCRSVCLSVCLSVCVSVGL